PGGAREVRLESHEQVAMRSPADLDLVRRTEEPRSWLRKSKPRMGYGHAVTSRGHDADRRGADESPAQRSDWRPNHAQCIDERKGAFERALGAGDVELDRRVARCAQVQERRHRPSRKGVVEPAVHENDPGLAGLLVEPG